MAVLYYCGIGEIVVVDNFKLDRGFIESDGRRRWLGNKWSCELGFMHKFKTGESEDILGIG